MLAKKMARSGSLAPREYFLMNSTYLTDEERKSLFTTSLREGLNGRKILGAEFVHKRPAGKVILWDLPAPLRATGPL